MASKSAAMTRRDFMQTTGLLAAGAAAAALSPRLAAETMPKVRLKLGIDNFSVRAMGWKAPRLLEYAAAQKVDVLLISDLDAYESLEDASLKELRAKSKDLGVQIHAGTWSICPTAKSFKKKWGTAEEHLRLGIRVARALGSPVLRCVLGMGEDRQSPGGIEARIADTVKVLQACRNEAVDSNVRIAVENHAGDMRASELVGLIEAAGRDFVGATLDSGNAVWALEDPLTNLEILGPYAVTTGIRDAIVWEDEQGAKVQWTAMGEGQVDWRVYMDKFSQLCPQAPVVLEIISGFAKPFPYLQQDFWQAWPKLKAADFARFLALARRGKAIPSHKSPNSEAEQTYQREELERSVRYCRETLGIGARA